MIRQKKSAVKGLVVVALALMFSAMVVSPQASGDLLAQGAIKVTQEIIPPPLKVIKPCNVSYKATTFQWYYTLNGTTLNGTLRVHVNFDHNTTSNFWNILEVINKGNITGNMSVNMVKWAQYSTYVYYNETYTSTVSVYMSHTWQSSASPGDQLFNNTPAGPYQLYPSNEVSYYIGVIYTEPVYPPGVPANSNAYGVYINFNFTVQLG